MLGFDLSTTYSCKLFIILATGSQKFGQIDMETVWDPLIFNLYIDITKIHLTQRKLYLLLKCCQRFNNAECISSF